MQCAKQPPRIVLCEYYICEYLRACSKFSESWRQLKKSKDWWRKEKFNHKIINQTVADICKFITDSCGEVREYMKLEHHARHEGLQVAGHALLRWWEPARVCARSFDERVGDNSIGGDDVHGPTTAFQWMLCLSNRYTTSYGCCDLVERVTRPLGHLSCKQSKN